MQKGYHSMSSSSAISYIQQCKRGPYTAFFFLDLAIVLLAANKLNRQMVERKHTE